MLDKILYVVGKSIGIKTLYVAMGYK